MANPPPVPQAALGFVGFVKISTGSKEFGIRATSCDLKLSQAIEKPDVVSGRFDKTVYKLGPKQVEGSIAFPATLETSSTGLTAQLMDDIWSLGVYRGSDGRLDSFTSKVKYAAENASFEFDGCMVNTLKWSVTQQDLVNIDFNVVAKSRTAQTVSSPTYAHRNTRAVTWADVFFNIYLGSGGGGIIEGEWVRSFDITINNNVERFYTCNGLLSPQDVAPKQRDITGTLTIMGRNYHLGIYSDERNQENCFADGYIKFGYEITNQNCRAAFKKKICGVIFEIETMSLRNDLIESTVNYHCLPGGQADELFDAIAETNCETVGATY